MAVERLFYENKDNKKRNKEIVTAMELSIKEFGSIEIRSSITNSKEGELTKRDELEPGWNGIEITLDEYLADSIFEKPRIIKDIIMGSVVDPKHEEITREAVDYILI